MPKGKTVINYEQLYTKNMVKSDKMVNFLGKI